jgi:hypothetical protein
MDVSQSEVFSNVKQVGCDDRSCALYCQALLNNLCDGGYMGKRDCQVGARMPCELKAWLEAEGKQQRRSISEVLVLLLEEAQADDAFRARAYAPREPET